MPWEEFAWRRDVMCILRSLLPLTQRRLSDIIGELDMFGIINAKVISKGRYGRTRDISIEIPENLVPRIKSLLEDVKLNMVKKGNLANDEDLAD